MGMENQLAKLSTDSGPNVGQNVRKSCQKRETLGRKAVVDRKPKTATPCIDNPSEALQAKAPNSTLEGVRPFHETFWTDLHFLPSINKGWLDYLGNT